MFSSTLCVLNLKRRGANTLARVTVGRFQPVARQTRPECPPCKLFEPLMRHRVRDNVDSQRIGFLFREFAEVPLGHSFAFPAVTQVGVVADENDHPLVVIVKRAVMRDLGIRSVPRSVPVAATLIEGICGFSSRSYTQWKISWLSGTSSASRSGNTRFISS